MSKGIIYLIQPAELVTPFPLKNGTVISILARTLFLVKPVK
jgi:hypothetical protein